MASAPARPAAPVGVDPEPAKMDSKQKAKHLRSLAASAGEEFRQMTHEASKLRGAAKQIQAEATNLSAKAKELSRQAHELERKPATQNISTSLPDQLKDVRQGRKRLRKAIRKGTRLAKLAGVLQDSKQNFELALEDSIVSVRLRKECLQELGAVAAALADAKSKQATNTSKGETSKRSTKPEMQKPTDGNTDTDVDELQIIDDTVEFRALFERKAEERSSALAQRKPQSDARPASAELDSLAEQQILAEQQVLAELQASAPLPSRTRREPEQQNQLHTAGAQSQQTPEQERRLGKYRPTSRDAALGLKWTLLSCETVRQDLAREINEGGTQPYLSGHIAVMHRKVAILQHFAQEGGAPPTMIEGELKALRDTISKAEPLANPESVQGAEKYLRRTDCRNDLHLTLRFEGAHAIDMAMSRKRKHEDEATKADVGDSNHTAIGHRDKRRRPNNHWSEMLDIIHVARRSNQEQVSIQGGISAQLHSSSVLDSRHTPGADGCRNKDAQEDWDDWDDGWEESMGKERRGDLCQ
jgi:hypothetical protein